MRFPLPAVLLAAPLLAQAPCVPVAEPAQVRPGDSVLLSWDCPTAAKVRLEPGGLILDGRARVTLRPTYTTTYRLFDARPGRPELGSVEVRIVPGLPLGEPARVCSFDASAAAVLPGEPVVLRWECTGSAKVRLEPGGLELDGKSEITITPLESTRYVLTATNAAGGSSRALDVTVLANPALRPPALACSFTADRPSVPAGGQVVLRWQCPADARIRLDPGGLELDGQSSVVVVPEATTVYTLNASNSVGGVSRSLEIRVEKPRLLLTEKDLGAPAEATPAAAAADPDARLRALQEADLVEAFRHGQAMRSAARGNAWTLRLVVSGSAPGLRNLARAAGSSGSELMILPYLRRDGFRWWQACWGAFASRGEAMKAWARQPESLKAAFGEPLLLNLKRLPGDPPEPAPGG